MAGSFWQGISPDITACAAKWTNCASSIGIFCTEAAVKAGPSTSSAGPAPMIARARSSSRREDRSAGASATNSAALPQAAGG